MGLVVANGYGRDPTACCDRSSEVYERARGGPPNMRLTLSLPPSLYLSLPLHPSPNGSQAATRCCVGSSKRASERSKQFSLMPSPLRPSLRRPPVRPPPTKIAFAFFPSLSANQRRASSKFPKRASFPPPPPPPSMAVGVKIPRSGLGAAFPSSQPRVGRPPARRGFSGARRRLPLSGLGLGCAARSLSA